MFAGRCCASSVMLSATAMPDTILDLLILLASFCWDPVLWFHAVAQEQKKPVVQIPSVSASTARTLTSIESIQRSDESISVIRLLLVKLTRSVSSFVSISSFVTCRFYHHLSLTCRFYKALPDDMSPATKAVEAVWSIVKIR